MATLSPLRAAIRTVPFTLTIAAIFTVFLWLNGKPLPALAAGTATALAMGPLIAQAPARLAWRLQEFAGQVPGDPEISMTWHGEQSLEWPSLDLTVEGNIHRYRLQKFTVHAGNRTLFLSSSRPREAARTALAELDEDPSVRAPSDRLPSLYPRLAGLKTGVLTSVLAGIPIGLGGPIVVGGAYPLWWWTSPAVVGVGAGLGRWTGLAHTKRALERLADNLRYDGVDVRTIDRTGGRIRLQFTVETASGSVPLTCVAIPYGSITAKRPRNHNETVSDRLPTPTSLVERVATWLRQRPTDLTTR